MNANPSRLPDDAVLPPATAGDRIDGAALQPSIDALRAIARALDDLVDDDLPVARLQQIARAQAALRSQAAALVGRQIDLLPGRARVAAEQINAAVGAADESLRRVADVKSALARVDALIGFAGAVASGDGGAIVSAANGLKDALTA